MRSDCRTALAVLVLVATGARVRADDRPQASEKVDFDRAIAPLLAANCLECHYGAEPKGGLDLSRRELAREGGDSGSPIHPGRPDESLLWQYVRDGKMPPKRRMRAAEMELLRKWIAQGATWGADPIDPLRFTSDHRAGYDWWSLQPIGRPKLPQSANRNWARNAIDSFVLDRLEAKGLAPSEPTDPRVQVRRLYYTLVGLPPPFEVIEDFASCPSDNRYLRLVDRLLSSPHFGERWGRHWLDLVRYGESDGFERNFARDNAWHYRDWVIGALNHDLPLDDFARLQIAGDVLGNGDAESMKATGFLVAGIHNTVLGANEVMRKVARQDELEELIATLGQTFLGVTVQCGRCHDHKFDPVTQYDYYRLVATLEGVTHGERPLEQLKLSDPARPEAPKVYAVVPQQPAATFLLQRGNVEKPLERVAPGSIQSIFVHERFQLAPDAPEAERRRALARWLTSPRNPLFARVAVNRLWHHHFGTGIVETPSDFGFNGGRPSHPELLDWLASELIDSSFSAKHIHRLIVTSSTFRQSSRAIAGAAATDAGNRLLWRVSPRRIEAEVLRDSLLEISGQLNRTMVGPGYRDVKPYHNSGTTYYEPIDPIGPEFNRRTVYRFSPRGERSPLLDTFDCPDPSVATPSRLVTTTPLQALALWNDSFVLRMADELAKRIQQMSAGEIASDKIVTTYQLVFGRKPDVDEHDRSLELVQKHGLPALCRALVNSNEFVIIP